MLFRRREGNFPFLGSGRSVAWLARLFRVQEVVSSNLTAPTISQSPTLILDSRLHSNFSQSAGPLSANLVYELPSILERLDLARLFPAQQPLEVELGCGDASFIAEYARLHPERNFVGVERLLGRIRKLDRKGRRHGLANLRGVRIENSYFLEWLLPAHSASAIHVYFPDPWPKQKHRRHRLINERFPALAQAALTKDGRVYLRTDHREYFEQMQAVFAASPQFKPAATPPELAAAVTDFERDFLAEGIPTCHAAYAVV